MFNLKLHRIVKEIKEKDEYIPAHAHPYFHYIYALSGEGLVYLDNEKFLLRSGMFLRCNPNVTHSIYGINSFQSFDIKLSCSNDLFPLISDGKPCVALGMYEDGLIKEIFHEAIRNDLYAEEIINAKMLELVFRILRKSTSTSNETTDTLLATNLNDKKTKCSSLVYAKQYIEENINKTISISHLAQLCGYSTAYFSSSFKEAYNCSPSKYIAMKRVEKAKLLMLTTSLNITQIADFVGVELHSFSKMFKKIVGISPIQYYNRANSNIGINISKNSPYVKDVDFEIPKKVLNLSFEIKNRDK